MKKFFIIIVALFSITSQAMKLQKTSSSPDRPLGEIPYLPDDVMILIISDLYQVEHIRPLLIVSKRFTKLVYEAITRLSESSSLHLLALDRFVNLRSLRMCTMYMPSEHRDQPIDISFSSLTRLTELIINRFDDIDIALAGKEINFFHMDHPLGFLGFTCLSPLIRLKRLEIVMGGYDRDFEPLSVLTSLKALDIRLRLALVTGAFLSHLSHIKLQSLFLYQDGFDKMLQAQHMMNLSRFVDLEHLSSREMSLDDHILEALSRSLVKLKSLNIADSDGISPEGVMHLSRLRGLNSLSVYCWPLVSINSLADLDALKRIFEDGDPNSDATDDSYDSDG